MARNCIIAIGINHYEHLSLPTLNYAERDATALYHFLKDEAAFEEYALCTDRAETIAYGNRQFMPSSPTFAHLERILTEYLDSLALSEADNLWFFFGGHGTDYKDQIYLLASDTSSISSQGLGRTALSLTYVTERLRSSGAGNVVLMLDACRNETIRHRGRGMREAPEQGVITISACDVSERSYEVPELQHGVFTYALLEGLRRRGKGNHTQVSRLKTYLERQIPALLPKDYHQTPQVTVDHYYKWHYLLLPRFASREDIKELKLDAIRAECQDYRLARRLWIRVLEVCLDHDAIEALERLAVQTGLEELGQVRDQLTQLQQEWNRERASWQQQLQQAVANLDQREQESLSRQSEIEELDQLRYQLTQLQQERNRERAIWQQQYQQLQQARDTLRDDETALGQSQQEWRSKYDALRAERQRLESQLRQERQRLQARCDNLMAQKQHLEAELTQLRQQQDSGSDDSYGRTYDPADELDPGYKHYQHQHYQQSQAELRTSRNHSQQSQAELRTPQNRSQQVNLLKFLRCLPWKPWLVTGIEYGLLGVILTLTAVPWWGWAVVAIAAAIVAVIAAVIARVIAAAVATVVAVAVATAVVVGATGTMTVTAAATSVATVVATVGRGCGLDWNLEV